MHRSEDEVAVQNDDRYPFDSEMSVIISGVKHNLIEISILA